METNSTYYWRKQLLWGVVLIGAGIVLFLDHAYIIDAHPIWHYWPFVLILFGINRIVGYTKAKHILSGFWMIFIGAWLFVSIEHIWELSFHTSWPFLLVVWGLELILKPVIRQYVHADKETIYGN